MAVQIKTDRTERPTITDLIPGRVRRTIYTTNTPGLDPWTLAVLGILGLGALAAPGIYRMFTGPTERAQARDDLLLKQLEAKINHDNAKIEKLQADSDKIRLTFGPLAEEAQKQKIEVIEENLPLDLHRKEITNEALEFEATLNRLRAPLILQEKQTANHNLQALIRQRQEIHEQLLDFKEVEADRVAAQTDLFEAQTEQQELNTRLLETAVDGLDFFTKQVFLRERLFPQVRQPAGQELTLQGRPLRQTSTITAF